MSNMKFKNSKFLEFITGKGFYVVVALCVAAIGTAAYITATNISKLQNDTDSQQQLLQNSSSKSSAPDWVNSQPQNVDNTISGVTDTPADTKPDTEQVANSSSKSSSSSRASSSSSQSTRPTAFVLPATGNMIKAFSNDTLVYSNTFKDWRAHNGIDLEAAKGTQIKAAMDGTVKAIADDPMYGKTIILDHGSGITSHYSSVTTEVVLTVGQKVTAGQVIATLGDNPPCEMKDPSHLHFSVEIDGKSVDPTTVVQQNSKS